MLKFCRTFLITMLFGFGACNCNAAPRTAAHNQRKAITSSNKSQRKANSTTSSRGNPLKAKPIATPEFDQRHNFVVKCPKGWGYRTFRGNNGLIGVFWPTGTSFYSTDMAAFVFLQDNTKKLPEKPCNINLFEEKCPKAKFKFLPKNQTSNKTLSLGEQYFNGRCGKTMVIIKVSVAPYSIIIMLASSGYITKKRLADLKEIAERYKAEILDYIERRKNGERDSSDNEPNDPDYKIPEQKNEKQQQGGGF